MKYKDLHQCEKDLLDLEQWLRFKMSQGDTSYLDFYYLIRCCDLIVRRQKIDTDSIPKKTNEKNIVTRYFELLMHIDILAFRNNIFEFSDIVVSFNRWSLPHDMI